MILLEHRSQSCPDVAPTGDHDALVRRLASAQLRHDRRDVIGGGEKEHFVIGLDHGVVFGQDRAAISVDCRDLYVDPRHVFLQYAQLLVDEGSAVEGLDRHELHAIVGEVEHLQRSGVVDQAFDVFGDDLLRANQHVDGHVLPAEESRARVVSRRADASDLGGGFEQGITDLAGHHVHLVTVRDCDQHVGIVGAGLTQHVRMRRVAFDGLNVEPIPELAQSLCVLVHQRDVEGLSREMLGEGTPYLARSKNDDLHVRFLTSDFLISEKKKPSFPFSLGNSCRPVIVWNPNPDGTASMIASGVCSRNVEITPSFSARKSEQVQ